MKGSAVRELAKTKRYLVMLVMLLVSVAAFSVPAKPGLQRLLTLADGTTVSASLVGDEHGHYWLGEDGQAYRDVDGDDIYEQVDAQNTQQQARQRRNAANRRFARRLTSAPGATSANYVGQKRGLIILVNFSDTKFKTADNKALYERIANEKDFNSGNFQGSMHDYFLKQSYGKFELTFDVVGPVTVSKNASYYGANDYQGNDKRPTEMVAEALELAKDEVDYKDYDWDGNGEVDQVYIVYAGKGEADGGSASTIWPHAWSLSEAYYYGIGSGAMTIDGVRIDTYACGSELDGNTSSVAGIGIMCHEFSHCLGYPDFYDIDYSGGQGMFTWDLMDSGSYNGDGYVPAGYTSYERWVAGWLEPIELTTTQTISNMKSLQDGGESYIIYNQGNRKEFFLLENRQQTGWDADIPGEGLLILHTDYSASAWAENTPNDDPDHQRMTWVAADNQYQYTTYQGEKYYTENGAKNDPFPYGSVNAFNKGTTPAAKFYNKNSNGTYFMDSSVESITQNDDGTISFNFVANYSPEDTPTDPTDHGSGNYELVTDATTLTAGDQLLIAYVTDDEAVALGTKNTNNYKGVSVTLNGDKTLTPNGDTQIITLEKDGSYYLFKLTDGYLYAASSTKNYLRSETEADDNAKATINIDSNGDATIVFQGSNTRNQLRYNANGGSPLFNCYASTSTINTLPQLYRKTAAAAEEEEEEEEEETPTQAEIQLGEGKTMAGYSFNKTLDFSGVANAKAWVATGFTRANKVIVTRVDIIPANTGIIVTSETPGDKIIVPVSDEMAFYANLLVPVLEEQTIYPTQTIDGVSYTFMGIGTITSTGETGFVKVAEEQLYGPNKSLLKVPTAYLSNGASNVAELEIVFDETSSIKNTTDIMRNDTNPEIYNLNGQRMSSQPTTRGIYIRNGKKIVIR